METAKIRKAGYPIRYNFNEFVDRFRYIAKNIPPSHKVDCKSATQKICETVFLNNEDYQLGNTKLFLKESENEFLEQMRNDVLAKYVLLIQKVIKGWICRKKFVKLREAAIVVQKYWRARGYRSRYLVIRNGYQRLQARICSRELSYKFNKAGVAISRFQILCKGYIGRHYSQIGKIYSAVQLKSREEAELKRSGNSKYKQIAELNFQKRLAELNREYKLKETQKEEENNRDNEFVDDLFDFLKGSGQELSPNDESERKAFMDMVNNEKKAGKLNLNDLKADVPAEDLSGYNFKKFAATYFHKNTNPQYSRRPLKESLLELPTPDDTLAAQALWITIQRFMGDIAEPTFEVAEKLNQPIMNRVQETLSRSFANRKEYKVSNVQLICDLFILCKISKLTVLLR